MKTNLATETQRTQRGKNTYGKNVFREVRVMCLKCKARKTCFMQCDTGDHDNWCCDFCRENTTHRVSEVSPLRPLRLGGKKS